MIFHESIKLPKMGFRRVGTAIKLYFTCRREDEFRNQTKNAMNALKQFSGVKVFVLIHISDIFVF